MSRNIITGIDIGTSQIRVVVSSAKERTEKGFPKVIGVGMAETRGMRHGYTVNIRELSESIRSAITMAEEKSNTKIRKTFIAINGVGLSSTTVTSSLITSRADAEITDLELSKLREQCEQDLPRSAKSNKRIIYEIPLGYSIDGEPVTGSPEGLTGNKIERKALFVTCFEPHVRELIQSINEAGIEVEDVMVGPIASGFVTLSKTQKVAGCIIINIGAETVSVVVFENGIPSSLEVFPIGSSDITNDIALGLKVSIEEAEQIKIGAITGSSYPRKKLEEIIAARLSDIFDLVEGHLKKIGRNGLLPAGIVLVGGGANLTGIEDLAKSYLKLPARIGNTGSLDNRSTTKDTAWSVAYGLCVWGLHAEDGPEIDTSTQIIVQSFKKIGRWFKQFLP